MSGLIEFVVDVSGFVPWGKRWKRALNNATKGGYYAAVRHWHKRMLPRHFGNAASARYGYTPRKGERGSGRSFKGSYTARKLREKGHTRPLDWSGELKRTTRTRTLKATKNRATCALPASRKANWKHPKSWVRMSDELTVIRDDELQELGKVAQRETEAALKAVEEAAKGSDNLVPIFVAAVKAGATLGEISDQMRKVFGVYKESVTL